MAKDIEKGSLVLRNLEFVWRTRKWAGVIMSNEEIHSMTENSVDFPSLDTFRDGKNGIFLPSPVFGNSWPQN